MLGIGIDVGSTNVKVALVDAEGALRASASHTLRTHQAGDVAEQDPDELWRAVRTAVRAVTSADPEGAARVAAVGVCSQYSSIVAVDALGAARSPVVMYQDLRGTERCWQIMEEHPDAFDLWVQRHGIPPIGGGLSLAHLLHLQHDRPEVHDATAAYLEVMDLVNLRLTGRAAATQCTMFASQLCDNRTTGATSYDADLVAASGVDASRLPELGAIDGVHGPLDAGVAAELGLPAGVQVRAGMNDTQAGAFATGTTTSPPGGPTRCGVVIGTTSVLIRPLPGKAVDLDHEVLSMPVPVEGHHVVMAENGIAGRAVEHALALLHGDAAAGFDGLEEALGRSAPGAGGAMFLPWLSGSMSPSSSSSMRGGFIGVSLSTSRDDLVRATVEGVARNLRWLLPAVDALAGGPADELVLGGGGGRSPGWAQVLADVIGRPVQVLERPELAAARAVGSVALARVAGEDPTALELPVAHRVAPDPRAAAVHTSLQPAFEQAFTALRPVCEALRP